MPKPPAKPVKHAPFPASNLGGHLKAPKSGEIMVEKTWGGKK